MAIRRLYNGNYQARVEAGNGRRLTRVFRTKREAEDQERVWRQQRANGTLAGKTSKQKTLDAFFSEWYRDQVNSRSATENTGWLHGQFQRYRDFVGPLLGHCKMGNITPQMIKKVLSDMAMKGKSHQTRQHVFNMLRKMFNDAIEEYCYVTFNPALRKLKPKVPRKEPEYLSSLAQIKRLLTYVEDKEFGLGVWIQIYTGLRVGELQALTWDDIDLESGLLKIRRTFVRKTNLVRDYPKGGRHHTVAIPRELVDRLLVERMRSSSDYVVPSTTGTMLQYKLYLKRLKLYCRKAEVPKLGTHGLRHSTWELYRSFGGTRDDMQRLFAHSSEKVTERYLHGHGDNLLKVANTIELFADKNADKKNPRLEKKSSADKKRTKFRLINCSAERR